MAKTCCIFWRWPHKPRRNVKTAWTAFWSAGFIRKLPHQLVEAFKATLEELEYADLLLHVIDVSNPEWQQQAQVVENLILELGAGELPRIDVFNKCDKFTGDILPHGADIVSISAKDLQDKEFKPINWVVEGLLPMGMGVLVAKPKLGKSWMVLDLCLAVAQGEPFLGFPTRQHGTLYLALEDGKSRMQTRLRRLLEGRPAPANMHVMFQAQRLGEGLLETLGEYLDANPDIHLVCIDTLSKIKPKAKPFENAYDADYDYMGRLKAFADSRGICVLLVHHTRKSKNPEDSFDNINGSTGILGAADFTIVLDKQSRMDDEAGFLLTGRDIEQCERVIRFDKARCRWVMQGTAAQLAAQRRVAEYEAEPIVKTLRVLLQQGDGTWSGNAQALMQMGERYTNEALASSTRALAGRIKELQPMLWERDAIKCWDKQNGTGGKRYCFKMNRIDNTVPVMDSTQLSLRHNYR